MKIVYLKIILLLILILVVTLSTSAYVVKLGIERFVEGSVDHELAIYYDIIPVNIWYVFASLVILAFGIFLFCIILGYFKGDRIIEEC